MNEKADAAQNISKDFPIVAIGASAGGVEAITELFKHVAPDTGMAFVYVQHLDPNFPSKLTEIISRVTKMNVVEAKNLMPLEPNSVYIIPPNKEMGLLNGDLILNARKEDGYARMPIDHFFISVSQNHDKGVIGIILSGTASDGTLGLRAIKSVGGISFAQDDSAQFQSMPRSAVSEGAVDMVLSPKQMAIELERLSKQKNLLLEVAREDGTKIKDDEEGDLKAILHLLKKSTSVDFIHYKMNTIRRRIVRRMLLHKMEKLSSYLQYLKQHTGEVALLYQDLLINVTSFFRDSDTMEYLKKTVVPKLLKSKTHNDPVRVWIPACSTGEEAYSLAMIFMEALGDRAADTSIQIFATDLSELAISKARLGVYTRNDVAKVSPRRLQRFFSKIDGSYRIVKAVRDLCVFAPHNVFRDPPFSRIDLVSCCNLMIYLDGVLQKKILATFHYALNPEGLLVLGKSESVGVSTQLFFVIEKKFKVFVKKKQAVNTAFFEMNYRLPDMERTESFGTRRSGHKAVDYQVDLEKMIDTILLEKYIPASVVVNQDLDILQFRGSTGLFLEPSPGKASLNLLKMAKPGLGFELRNTIHKAGKSGQPVKKNGLQIKLNETVLLVSIEAVPIKSETEDKLFLVIFEQVPVPDVTELRSSLSKDKLVNQLQNELTQVKEDMRSIIEEQEASNEELQSANEEIVSSNEELQSINEELETSKEELESTNEELMTINAELQVRNEQLEEAYEYAEAVFGTLREAILVLDKDLRVRSANRSFYSIFQIREEETEGTLIYELADRQWDIPELRELLNTLSQKGPCYGVEIRNKFKGIGEKIMLMNACRVVQKIHQQQIYFIAIEDVTDLRNK